MCNKEPLEKVERPYYISASEALKISNAEYEREMKEITEEHDDKIFDLSMKAIKESAEKGLTEAWVYLPEVVVSWRDGANRLITRFNFTDALGNMGYNVRVAMFTPALIINWDVSATKKQNKWWRWRFWE